MLSTGPSNCIPFEDAGELSQLSVHYEAGRNTLWVMSRPQPRPCFTPQMGEELLRVGRALKTTRKPIDFWVSGSDLPGIFQTGGDLAHFVSAITRADRASLLSYAKTCVDAIHGLLTGFGTQVVTLAMVEGTALGGGLEAALAHHFLLAQDDASMGFPEIEFNLFPGMGAYSLVARKASAHLAETLIRTGQAHPGAWFANHGLVEQTFAAGQGLHTTRSFIDEMHPKLNGIRAMLRARSRISRVSYEELMAVATDWVDVALDLNENDIIYMKRLISLQNRRMRSLSGAQGPRSTKLA